MDPSIETVIDKAVTDPGIAAEIKNSAKVVDGRTHLNLSALIDSSEMLRKLEPQFIGWVSDLGFEWKRLGAEAQGGLLDAYRDSGHMCNYKHALPDSMKSRKDYSAAYSFGMSMANARN